MSSWLNFQRFNLAFQPFITSFITESVHFSWRCWFFSSFLPILMSVHLLREKVLERHFFLWNGFYSSLDFHKLVLRGECGVTEILLWRLQKVHCNVWTSENTYFPRGTSFPCVQINAFIRAVNVFHRWYSVLPNSRPSEISVQSGIIDCSCVQVVFS